ncbi:hypothetical protein AB1L88_14085 [Tautonia sp. JC769]|uniref:hypothetical protein n=1 Tax=Tautonia sp. JC769 TaxID=3232135 RepID=UPI0034591495
MRRTDALVAWDDEDDLSGNLHHVREHGLSPDEVESVLLADDAVERTSRSSGRPLVAGFTFTGRWIVVVYEVVAADPVILRPVTAYEPDPKDHAS